MTQPAKLDVRTSSWLSWFLSFSVFVRTSCSLVYWLVSVLMRSSRLTSSAFWMVSASRRKAIADKRISEILNVYGKCAHLRHLPFLAFFCCIAFSSSFHSSRFLCIRRIVSDFASELGSGGMGVGSSKRVEFFRKTPSRILLSVSIVP